MDREEVRLAYRAQQRLVAKRVAIILGAIVGSWALVIGLGYLLWVAVLQDMAKALWP